MKSIFFFFISRVERWSQIMNMQNKTVFHRKFGKGIIVDLNQNKLSVQFDAGKKIFLYPDAFRQFLVLMEKDSKSYVDGMLKEMDKKEEISNRIARKMERHNQLIDKLKLHPSSQIVIRFFENDKSEFLQDNVINTGLIQTGKTKGSPVRPSRLHQNSACILTERKEEDDESSRTIFGIAMVEEDFLGTECKDGKITLHSKYVLILPDDLQKLKFWNYYTDERYPDKLVWKSGEFRYCSNLISAQILKDIMSLPLENETATLAEEFYHYFCEINQIEESTLPLPSGKLL